MVMEYATGAGTNHVTATGWTEITWRDQVAATGRTDLVVMGRISDGSEGATVAFTIAGTVNHVHGQMLAITTGTHGVSNIATDLVVGTITGGAAGGSNPQTDTLPGITVAADSLVLLVHGTALDANSTTQYGSWTNSNLTSITERMDTVVLTGNGGGFGSATGISASGGAIGSSTVQQATNEAWNGNAIGIPPAATGGAIPPGLIRLRARRSLIRIDV